MRDFSAAIALLMNLSFKKEIVTFLFDFVLYFIHFEFDLSFNLIIPIFLLGFDNLFNLLIFKF